MCLTDATEELGGRLQRAARQVSSCHRTDIWIQLSKEDGQYSYPLFRPAEVVQQGEFVSCCLCLSLLNI